nr:hypothetical protein GCM10020092_093180 [Actinoplanes digitatis]
MGLVGESTLPDDRAAMILLLQLARVRPLTEPAPLPDTDQQDRRLALERRSRELHRLLKKVMSDRALLLDQQDGQSGYRNAVELQVGRLQSLGLLDLFAA